MRVNRFYRKHVQELATGYYGEGYIRGLKMAMRARSFRANGYSATAANVDAADLDRIITRICAEHPRIRDEQAVKGIAWLRKVARTPKGTPRKNSPFGDYELAILDTFSHFTLVDFYDVGARRGSHVSDYLPVYRVHGANGKTFDYMAGSWQSGQPIEILD